MLSIVSIVANQYNRFLVIWYQAFSKDLISFGVNGHRIWKLVSYRWFCFCRQATVVFSGELCRLCWMLDQKMPVTNARKKKFSFFASLLSSLPSYRETPSFSQINLISNALERVQIIIQGRTFLYTATTPPEHDILLSWLWITNLTSETLCAIS